MKKILLVLLVILGLQAKAQINICDSIEYSIQSAESGPSSTILTLNGTANISSAVVSWNWAACHSTLCFAASGQVATFNQFATTDTIKLCLTTILDINGMTWTCDQCDSLVWDGFGGWILLHSGNPVSIQEVNKLEQDNKIYDILGREFYDYNSIPKGTLYIKNREKFIK